MGYTNEERAAYHQGMIDALCEVATALTTSLAQDDSPVRACHAVIARVKEMKDHIKDAYATHAAN